MANEIIFHHAVSLETEEVVKWYETQKQGLGILFLEMLNVVVLRIQKSPLQFQAIYKDIRKARIADFPYNIYFKVHNNEIINLAILHQKRHDKLWKKRK